MSSPLRPFQSSQLWTQCEECRRRVNLSGAGACSRCLRVLCSAHLHGSLLRLLIVDFGADALCVQCRAERARG